MYQDKKIIAIIPARMGSKGIKDKNIKHFAGIPLLAHSVEVAKKSDIFDEIFVSTDSPVYGDIAKQYGAQVPFYRPQNLSQDSSQAYDYVEHTIQTYKNMLNQTFDYFVVLQPTSPIRLKSHIEDVISLLVDEGRDAVVSVCEADHIPQIYNHLPEDGCLYNFYTEDKTSFNRQDFGKYYKLNGSIYAMKVSAFLQHRSYYIQNSKAYLMEKEFSMDIDSELDFMLAERMVEILHEKGNYV